MNHYILKLENINSLKYGWISTIIYCIVERFMGKLPRAQFGNWSCELTAIFMNYLQGVPQHQLLTMCIALSTDIGTTGIL